MKFERINSLPDRPLTIEEADKLTQSGKFVPLNIMQILPPDAEPNPDDLAKALDNAVVSLLHATDEKGVTVAYADDENCWVKAVSMSADEYDPQEIEAKTEDFVDEHWQSEIDSRQSVDVEDYQ